MICRAGRACAVTGALLIAAIAVGCQGSAAGNLPAANAQNADETSAGLIEHDQHHHHGGMTLFVALSLDSLGVSPDQRPAIEKIEADLRAAMEPARAAEQALQVLIATGIAAGALDRARVDAAVAQVSAAATAVHDASIDAFNRLHAMLTAPQRVALADKVEAHWEVWQAANAREQRGPAGEPRKGGHLERLVREVELTQQQVDAIHANLAEAPTAPFDAQPVDSQVRAFAEAFRAEAFDAKTVAVGKADTSLASFGAARMARFYQAVDPVLTAEQRTKLADILREHASYDPVAKGG